MIDIRGLPFMGFGKPAPSSKILRHHLNVGSSLQHISYRKVHTEDGGQGGGRPLKASEKCKAQRYFILLSIPYHMIFPRSISVSFRFPPFITHKPSWAPWPLGDLIPVRESIDP